MIRHLWGKNLTVFLLIGLLTLGLCGCGGGKRVYLANDACLIKTGQYSRPEVVRLLGPPARITRQADGRETWYYYNINKSLLKRIPLLGGHLGREEVEILEIVFLGNQVYQCRYQVREKN